LRLLLFVVAFAIALASSAPLERWVLPYVRGPLSEAGIELRVESLRLALPAGIRADGIVLEGRGTSADLDSVYVGLGRTFDARACNGHLAGSFTSRSFELALDRVNPTHCLHVGKLSLETVLSGSFAASGFDLSSSGDWSGVEGRVNLSAPAGVFRGILEHAGRGGEDLPLGEWEFQDLVLKARLSKGRLAIEEGRTNTSGVQWEILAVELPGAGGKGGLRIDFRARAADDGPRARALLGLMPKSAEDASGWRHFRVVGSLSSPRVVAAD
jgi:type II secretion system protein N